MKVNDDQCHLLLSLNNDLNANIGEAIIKCSNDEKLLGVTIDNKLSFVKNINNLCDKACKKLNVLASILSYMNLNKRNGDDALLML